MRSCGIPLLSLKSLSLSVSLSICMQLYRLYTYRNTVQHCATNHHLWHRFEFWCATYYWKHAAWTWRPPRPKDSRYLGPSNEQALPPIARPWQRHGWRGQLWGGLTLDSCDLVIGFPLAMKPEPCTQDRQWLATVQEWVRAAWLCFNNWATLGFFRRRPFSVFQSRVSFLPFGILPRSREKAHCPSNSSPDCLTKQKIW